MGDATFNNNRMQSQNNIMEAFQKSGKRPRNQFEEITPTPSREGSNITTDASDISTSTSEISLPQLQLNHDLLPVESVETVIETSRVDRDKLKLAFKVDNLNDKL